MFNDYQDIAIIVVVTSFSTDLFKLYILKVVCIKYLTLLSEELFQHGIHTIA